MDVCAIILRLCFRGKFFPFSGKQEYLLENFHPVILYDKFGRRIKPGVVSSEKVEPIPSRSFFEKLQKLFFGSGFKKNEFERYCLDVYKELYNNFNLTISQDDFSKNNESLNKEFNKTFPETAKSQQFQNYILERKLIFDQRKKLFSDEASDPLRIADIPLLEPERFITMDSVFVVNDKLIDGIYERNTVGLPLFAHDMRMINGAVGDYLVFGDRSLLDEVLHIINIIMWFYKLPSLTEKEVLSWYRFGTVEF